MAAFGQKLAGYNYVGSFGYSDISDLARDAAGEDRSGYRDEFIGLVARAGELATNDAPVKISGGPR